MRATLTDCDGNVIDLSQGTPTVTFRMAPLAGGAATIEALANIDVAVDGKVSHDWITGETDVPGFFLAEWMVDYEGDGDKQTFPNEGYLLVLFTPRVDQTNPLGLYITREELKKTLSIGSEANYANEDIDDSLDAACRSIDEETHRHFLPPADNSNDETRYYTPDSWATLEINDVDSISSVSIDRLGNGTFSEEWTLNTDFVLEPLNAALDNRPFERIKVHPYGTFRSFSVNVPRSVRVEGQFGWASTPPGIVSATKIIATKLLKRTREAPFGVIAVGVDMGSQALYIARNDPDVYRLIRPFVRNKVLV
jgi:hypothetical protein